MRRTISILSIFSSLTLMACSPGAGQQTTPTPIVEPTQSFAPGYPVGFESWTRWNDAAVVRQEGAEERDLFYNESAVGARTGAFPVGTVLVKAQYHRDGGTRGDLFQVSVMRKTGEGATAGWEFEAFDGQSGQRMDIDADACVLCHTARAGRDYVFSDRSVL